MTIRKILLTSIFLVCVTACRATATPAPQTSTATPASRATASSTSSLTSQPSSTASPTPAPARLWWELESLPVTLRTAPESPETDVVFFRTDGLWRYDHALAQEHQLAAGTLESVRRVPGSLTWSPDAEHVAYLTYREEDEGSGQWANITVVELATGATTPLPTVPIFIPGGLAWSPTSAELYAIGARENKEGMEWGLYAFSVASEAAVEVLLTERRSGTGLSGPLQVTLEGYVRYLHFEPRTIALKQFHPAQGTPETIVLLPGASAFPFAVPHQTLPDAAGVLYLLSTMQTGWETRLGLHHVADEKSQQLLTLEEGCGLEIGLGQGRWVALGCGPAESSPFVICDVSDGSCRQLHEPLRDALLPILNPEDLPFSTIKFTPIAWRAKQLYFTALLLGPGVSDLGGLFRYDMQTGESMPLLLNLEEAVLEPLADKGT